MEILIIDDPKEAIFIHILRLSEQHDVEILCNIAKVSLSGYYRHRTLLRLGNTKQERESGDVELLQELCKTRKKGYRSITMQLQRKNKTMNHKKVLRLMKKYDLLAKVRRRNPYRHILKAGEEHRIKKNILARKFREEGDTPLQKFGTDITYLKLKEKWCYLSIIRDMTTGEIPSFILSKNLCMGATLKSIDMLTEKFENSTLKSMLLHSDQGFHYTHPEYQKKLKDAGITQSMSRKGNCLDNAPTESFFGHLKDEIDITDIQSFKELEKYIENYIFEYNNSRPQWNKKKMTPVEYRNHLLQNKN